MKTVSTTTNIFTSQYYYFLHKKYDTHGGKKVHNIILFSILLFNKGLYLKNLGKI